MNNVNEFSSDCGVEAIPICGLCWGVGVSKQKPEELFVLNIVPSFWGLRSQWRSRNGLVRHKLLIYWSINFQHSASLCGSESCTPKPEVRSLPKPAGKMLKKLWDAESAWKRPGKSQHLKSSLHKAWQAVRNRYSGSPKSINTANARSRSETVGRMCFSSIL